MAVRVQYRLQFRVTACLFTASGFSTFQLRGNEEATAEEEVTGTTLVDFSNTARLEIVGTNFESETGELYSQRTVVPVPAAIWLFATALVGLVGLSKPGKAA